MSNGISNIQIIETEKMLKGIEGDIYTYAEWKKQGFQVQKGQKAAMKAKIWQKNTKAKDKEGKIKDYYFMVMASFFTENQVKEIR